MEIHGGARQTIKDSASVTEARRKPRMITFLWMKGYGKGSGSTRKLIKPARQVHRVGGVFPSGWDLPKDWQCSSCGCCGCHHSSRCGSQGDEWAALSPKWQNAAPVASVWLSLQHSLGGWGQSCGSIIREHWEDSVFKLLNVMLRKWQQMS